MGVYARGHKSLSVALHRIHVFGQYVKHDSSALERRIQTHYIYYDPVSGYIHKFRLDGSQEPESGDGSLGIDPISH
jgi:hypothetical protein